MPPTIKPSLGWNRCAQIANEHAELLVTLDVGPRILSYQLPGGVNVLRTFPDELGGTGEAGFQARGGHRMWVAPENDRTYAPDNGPTKFELQEPNGVRVETPAAAPWNVRKEMNISLAADSASVMVQHRAFNEGTEAVNIASWALTVMTPGGWQIIPQPPLRMHGSEFLPDRVIVPWTYTDLSDDRWRFGKRFWTLTPKDGRPATKLGFAHRQRWVAYVLPAVLFIKVFDFEEGATYPDLGCNYETFCKGDLIELESLGPLRTVGPGQSVGHTESWHLFADSSTPSAVDESAIERWLQPYLGRIGIA